MPKPTTLATGQVTNADALSVELHEPADLPPFILVVWPAAPSVTTVDGYDRLVSAVYKVLADARVTLTRRRGNRRTK